MFSQDDDGQGLVLGVLAGVIALVLALVIGVGVYSKNHARAASTKPAAAASAVVQASGADRAAAVTGAAAVTSANSPSAADAASVVVENGIVKFYFASGKSALAAGGSQALSQVVTAVATGKKVVISGFHDATGNAAQNAELAKKRSLAVQGALKSLGVPEDRIELKKPESLPSSGSDAEARRVEVVLQ